MANKHYSPRILLALLGAGLLGQGQAASIAEWEGCSSIPADVDRLACYDRVSGRSQPQPEVAATPPADAKRADLQPGLPAVAAQPVPVEPDPELLSALSRHWELEDEAKQG
ncbi:MAG: hypothetical protein ACYC1G_16090, partial [Thiobacillus sp.]